MAALQPDRLPPVSDDGITAGDVAASRGREAELEVEREGIAFDSTCIAHGGRVRDMEQRSTCRGSSTPNSEEIRYWTRAAFDTRRRDGAEFTAPEHRGSGWVGAFLCVGRSRSRFIPMAAVSAALAQPNRGALLGPGKQSGHAPQPLARGPRHAPGQSDSSPPLHPQENTHTHKQSLCD